MYISKPGSKTTSPRSFTGLHDRHSNTIPSATTANAAPTLKAAPSLPSPRCYRLVVAGAGLCVATGISRACTAVAVTVTRAQPNGKAGDSRVIVVCGFSVYVMSPLARHMVPVRSDGSSQVTVTIGLRDDGVGEAASISCAVQAAVVEPSVRRKGDGIGPADASRHVRE